MHLRPAAVKFQTRIKLFEKNSRKVVIGVPTRSDDDDDDEVAMLLLLMMILIMATILQYTSQHCLQK